MNTLEAKDWLTQRVSRETMVRLETYHEMLIRWQRTLNLVAPSTLDAAWSRHFVDSAQLLDLSPELAHKWLDLGAGAGFPGLVVSAMTFERRPDLNMTVIESDKRKCGFMREAARAMRVRVNILPCRIAEAPLQKADVVTARALGSLKALIDHAKPHVVNGACLLFPKGASFQEELVALTQRWQTQSEIFQSVTDPAARIVRLTVPETEEES